LVGCGSHDLGPAERDDKEHAELAKALKGVKVSLEKGLSASESQGNPISRKFEVEDGKLQLSVYTIKGDKFPEVIIDHKTGRPQRPRRSQVVMISLLRRRKVVRCQGKVVT